MSVSRYEKVDALLKVISSFEGTDGFENLYASRGSDAPPVPPATLPRHKYTVTIETTNSRFLEEFAAFLLMRETSR